PLPASPAPLPLSLHDALPISPSVVHAEALLRAIELRRATLDEPLDALVIAIPGVTPFLPRENPNPLLAAHLGLAHALGLWRDALDRKSTRLNSSHQIISYAVF